MRSGERWEDRTVALAAAPAGDSPLEPWETRWLGIFSQPRRIADALPDLTHIEAERVLGPGEPRDALLRVYLRTQKLLALGILVEEARLSAAEVGAMLVAEAVDVESGRAGPVRVSDLSRVAAVDLAPDPPPLEACRRPDGALVLLKDARVAYAAFQRGIGLRSRLLPAAEFLARLADLPSEFFGTMRDGMPYHSIWCEGEEVVRGRRPDLRERLSRVRTADLAGKGVLDLGCNIGMNCFLAVEAGARFATGIDLPPIALAAARLNAYYGLPCRFLGRDINHEVTGLPRHDTVFVFALVGHLHTIDGVLRTIENVEANAVYVETHCEIQPQGDLPDLLAAPLFRNVEFLGYCQDNVVRRQKTRKLFRCEVRHDAGRRRNRSPHR